jgi:ABC-type uncharacterized transport system substrate-binding protein
MRMACDAAQNADMHSIRRRLLVVGVGALLARPLVGQSQPTDKPRRIGFLSSETVDSEGAQLAQKLIPEALKQRGWIEGGNLVIEWRWANGKIADLPELAAELVRNKVEIVVARTNLPISRCACRRTSDLRWRRSQPAASRLCSTKATR